MGMGVACSPDSVLQSLLMIRNRTRRNSLSGFRRSSELHSIRLSDQIHLFSSSGSTVFRTSSHDSSTWLRCPTLNSAFRPEFVSGFHATYIRFIEFSNSCHGSASTFVLGRYAHTAFTANADRLSATRPRTGTSSRLEVEVVFPPCPH